MGNFGDRSKIKYYGRIKDAPHEVPGRQDDWSENRVQSVTFIGKYDDVKAKMDSLRPGLPMGTFNSWTDKAFAGNTFIRTMSLARGEGDTGELHVTDVRCPKGAEQPYNKVWEVGMEEVQKKLITHPNVQKHGNVDILFKWEETPKRYRTDGNGDFWYATGEMDGDEPQLEKITGDANIAYCKAVMAGIETYNEYLPVLSCTSYYVKLPGILYDADGIVNGGTIHMDDDIGTFDTPKVTVRGFSDGIWLKSMDKFIENADGTCTRQEQWTYTKDKKHRWIYDTLKD